MGSKFGTRCCHRSMFSLAIVVPLNLMDTSSPSARARFRRALRMILPGIFLNSFHSLNFWVYCLRLEEHEESAQAGPTSQLRVSRKASRQASLPGMETFLQCHNFHDFFQLLLIFDIKLFKAGPTPLPFLRIDALRPCGGIWLI
jgi:hypothetical protein